MSRPLTCSAESMPISQYVEQLPHEMHMSFLTASAPSWARGPGLVDGDLPGHLLAHTRLGWAGGLPSTTRDARSRPAEDGHLRDHLRDLTTFAILTLAARGG